MPLSINPICLNGPWDHGWALDWHTLSSQYVGDDSYGHPPFDTKRSELGEALYQFKYRGDAKGLPAISETVSAFLIEKALSVDVIVSVPPSNEGRRVQPLPAISAAVAQLLTKPYRQDGLIKVRQTKQLKEVFGLEERSKLLADVFRASSEILDGRRVLLLDDLYRSGATLRTATTELRQNGRASLVIAITLTRTRSVG